MEKEKVNKAIQLQQSISYLEAELFRIGELVDKNQSVNVFYNGTFGGGCCVIPVTNNLCWLSVSDLDTLGRKKESDLLELKRELEAL